MVSKNIFNSFKYRPVMKIELKYELGVIFSFPYKIFKNKLFYYHINTVPIHKKK